MPIVQSVPDIYRLVYKELLWREDTKVKSAGIFCGSPHSNLFKALWSLRAPIHNTLGTFEIGLIFPTNDELRKFHTSGDMQDLRKGYARLFGEAAAKQNIRTGSYAGAAGSILGKDDTNVFAWGPILAACEVRMTHSTTIYDFHNDPAYHRRKELIAEARMKFVNLAKLEG